MNTSDSLSIKMNKTNASDESSKTKDNNESTTVDNKDDWLYKNVLKKGAQITTDKTEKHLSLDIDSFTSDFNSKQSINDDSPLLPIKKNETKIESRINRRMSSSELTKSKRSSSNQSLKSSKSVINLK